MAWRQLHDDVPVSATLSQLSHLAERLFWRLLSQTDSWGRLPGDRDKIRARAIPRLDVTNQDLESALEELVRAGRIQLYVVSNVWHCQVVDFDDNQLVAKMKRAKSKHPDPPTICLLEPSSTERDREDRRESVLPTAVARDPANGLPFTTNGTSKTDPSDDGLSRPDFGNRTAGGSDISDLAQLAESLGGHDDKTVNVLRKYQRDGCGEREFATALESLKQRRAHPDKRALTSEVRYFVSTLRNILNERGASAA